MKNLGFTILLLLLCSIVFAFQDSETYTPESSNEDIQTLLVEAEEYINILDFELALEKLERSQDLAKELDHKRYIALTSSILAKLHFIRHDYDRANTELQRAISIQREIGDDMGLAYSYVNFSKLFILQSELDRANKYLKLAKSLYLKHNDQSHLGIIHLNQGIIHINLENKNKEAITKFDLAEDYLKKANDPYELSRLYYFRGSAYLKSGDSKTAELDAKRGLEVSETEGFHGMMMSTNELLSRIYTEKGEPEVALNYLKKSNEMRDAIFKMNKESIASEANAKYGVDALKSTLNEVLVKNANQEKSLKINKLTTILSVALITILSLLTLSLYKNNNLRARANELLQKKNTELTLAKENAEKASMAKAQFLSTITHELRTPLYAVTGLTHLLLDESPTENQKEHLNSLKFSGEYLLSLINNILDLNKLEANKVEIMETSFNLKKRISDVIITLKNSADDKRTKINFEFDKTVPKKVKGDPLIISQILINLIGNSIKFTTEGEIWIRVKKTAERGKFVSLLFEIEDNGEGITKEKQKAIFENFTQGSTEINRKFGGTGLGLSIVKNLITLLNSEITLESDIKKGAKFTFELQFEVMEKAEAPKKINSSTPISNNIMEDKRILIVEDNKINQMITRKILEKHKVICDVADNGTIAIEKVTNNHFDLILMDIHMPGISGIEATIEIRKFNEDIPIIALTAVTLDENLEDFFLNGFNDIIPKPYKTEEFFQKINKYLALSEPAV